MYGKKTLLQAVDFVLLIDVATLSNFWTLKSLLFRQRWACKVLQASGCVGMARCNAWRIPRLCWDQPAKLIEVARVCSRKPLASVCSRTSWSLMVASVASAWLTRKIAASCLGLLAEEPCKQLSLRVMHQIASQRQVRQIDRLCKASNAWTKTLGEERKTSGQQKREQEGAKTTPSHSPNCIQIRLVLVTFGGLQCYHCVAVECVCGCLPHPPETCPGWPPQAPACFKKLTSTKCQGPLQNGTLQNDPEVLNSTENVSTQWLWQKVSTKCASAQNAGTKSISQHQVHCLVKRFTVN